MIKKMPKMRGFTFIEMVVVITLTSLLMSSGAMIFSKGITSYFIAQQLNGLSIEAEQALTQLSRELRMAYRINGVSPTELNFTSNKGADVRYQLSGTELRRSQDGGTTYYPSSNHVSSFAISYFDSDLAETATPANVRLINITINFIDNENTMQLIQSAYLRSLL